MNPPLPRWLSRTLAVGLLLAVVGVVAAATVGPVWRLSSGYEQRIDEVRRQLQRFTNAAGQQDRLRSDRDRLRASGGGQFYLPGSTAALAAAELQRVVKRIVTSQRGQIMSTQVVPTDDSGEVQRVVLRVRMRGDIATVQGAFHALETGQPYLFLENVRMRVWGGRMRRNVADTVQQLDVNFDLMGYLLIQDAESGA